MDLERIIHEHFIIFSVRSFVLRNDKLVFIFTEIKLTDNAVQLILSLISFSYGTADLKNKIVFEMLYCCPCLIFCCILKCL